RAVADQRAELALLRRRMPEILRRAVPQERRRDCGDDPRDRVGVDRPSDRELTATSLLEDPPGDQETDPRDRLSDPVRVQRVPHDLQTAAPAEVHLAERDERER